VFDIVIVIDNFVDLKRMILTMICFSKGKNWDQENVDGKDEFGI